MDYTSIHIYGHLLSDDILHEIETDANMVGNREQDFNLDVNLTAKIDNAWSSLRNDWSLFCGRNLIRDPYGTKSVRRLMERFFSSLDYQLNYQPHNVEVGERSFDITYLAPELDNMPVIIVGDKTGDVQLDTLDKCTLDIRAKGGRRQKSPHATMLDYLNNTEHVYGIVTNGQVLRIIRNTGQLVKLTYAEFDLLRMVEEDHYAEFVLMFRLLHSSRFIHTGDDPCVLEQWFNRSVESGNRIRAGLSDAVQKAMEILGLAIVCGEGDGNKVFREAFLDGKVNAAELNKELIHFIYRLLFLFIIEDRNLVYRFGDPYKDPDYEQKAHCLEIYRKYYAVSRLRHLSELPHLRNARYHDLWEGLMDSFHLFEDESFGAPLFIKPLGGTLFNPNTLHWIKQCTIGNDRLLAAFNCLNEFLDDKQNRVKINYSALDVEEFGSVYEGILEMRAVIIPGQADYDWQFTFGAGLDRKSSSSYYTRPDLVQSLIRTTLEPVIKERIAQCTTPEEQVQSLLSMKVCDAASGSGHIVLAMARTIAWYVCSIRTGEDNPASLDYRDALREVIQKCVYAVDYNPDAVELCKVVLWIEGYCAGKPLSFLDHHIRCGNSVVGVTDLQMLIDGVPAEAFTADSNDTKRELKKLNAEAIKQANAHGHDGIFAGEEDPFGISEMSTEQIGLAEKVAFISHLPEDTMEQEEIKKQRWEDLMRSARVDCLREACNIYTYAFYHTAKHEELYKKNDATEGSPEHLLAEPQVPYSKTVYRALQQIDVMERMEKGLSVPRYYLPLTSHFKSEVYREAEKHRYFHWCIEFPDVFVNNGKFDVMCGNPPWDKLQMEDEKWFIGKNNEIVKAANQSARNKLITNLQGSDPKLYTEYMEARAAIASESNFVKNSGRFPLTACGKIDLYSLFAEHNFNSSKLAWGVVIPTGIATNDSTKAFFGKLIEENRLESLYDFENKEGLFDIHRMFKFCLLTAGKQQQLPREVTGGFYLTRLDHLLDPNRIYKLDTEDFIRLNPNTKTCPIFRTARDARLTAKIYRNAQVLIDEGRNCNPWEVKFGSMFNMSTDSHLFRTFQQLTEEGAILKSNNFLLGETTYVPLYEGKMIYLYNHHYADWPTEGERPNSVPTPAAENLADPNHTPIPWYWVDEAEVANSLVKTNAKHEIVWEWKHQWLLGFRDITNATNERTFIPSLIPDASGVGHSATLLIKERGAMPAGLLLGMMSSLIFDYTTRQKIGGSHASISFVKQFPVLSPEQISTAMARMIIERVTELCYFNHDLDGWMEELWSDGGMTEELQTAILARLDACNGGTHTEPEPFIYNEGRRSVAQAELDAIFAHLYGLSTEDLRYILDPEDVCGPGCINETFRVLKDREVRELGEYRTKRLVMDAWKKFKFNE